MVQAAWFLRHDIALTKGFQYNELDPFWDIINTRGCRPVPNPAPPFVCKIERRTKEGGEQQHIHDYFSPQ